MFLETDENLINKRKRAGYPFPGTQCFMLYKDAIEWWLAVETEEGGKREDCGNTFEIRGYDGK